MSLFDHVAALFGYDRAHLGLLADKDARRVCQLAALSFVPVVLSGVSAGLLVWMSEHDPLWTPLIALFVALLVWNLLRLNNAGGGPAPDHTAGDAERWAPGGGAISVLALLAALSAQPFLAFGFRQTHQAEVNAHRQALMAAHEKSLADANSEPLSVGASNSLARCEFVALRLKLLWKDPERPLLLSLAFAALYLSPLLLAQLTHLGALRRYQRLRWSEARSLVLDEEALTQSIAARHLSRYPGPLVCHLHVVPPEGAPR